MKNCCVITFGDGKVWTQRGNIEELKCLTMTVQDKHRPIGSKPKQWKDQADVCDHDVVIVFKNIESARVLQDELNLLIAEWSQEKAEAVD